MRKCLLLLALICATAKLIAQVDLQTGNLQLSFPIYNYSDEKTGLSSSVSLSYSSRGGVKTDQMASPAGLGFDLMAGGYIQRVQVGAPDDQKMRPEFVQSATCFEVPDWRTYLTTHATMSDNSGSISPAPYIDNYFPNGYLYSDYPITVADASIGSDCRKPYSKGFIPLFKSSDNNKLWKPSRHSLADHEQDIFYFNINGKSGQFVIGRNREIRTMPQSKMKVVFDDSQDLYAQGIRTRITSFTVTDESGFKYYFDKYETSEVTTQTETSRDAGSTTLVKSESLPLPIQKQFVITKWFLSKIEPPFVTERKITFEYDPVTLVAKQGYFTTLNFEDGNADATISVAEQTAYLKTWQLKKISFPDGKYVKFHYETIGRIDVPGMNPVKEMTFFTDDKYAGGVIFNYGYFYKKQINDYSFGVADSKFARLCLKSFQMLNIAGEKEPPYVFEYNIGSSSSNPLDIVAPPFSFARDHWGYYNKMSGIGESYAIPQKDLLRQIILTTTSTSRAASDNAASLGLLSAYTMPQGGKISFEYSQNRFQHPQQGNIIAGGVSVSKITKNALDGVSPAMVTSYSYKNADGTSSLWGYESIDNNAYNFFKSINQYHDNNFKYAGDVKTEQAPALRIISVASQIYSYGEKAYKLFLAAKALSSGAQLSTVAGSFVSTGNIALMWLSMMFKLYMNNRELNTVTEYNYYDPLWSANPVGFQYSRALVKSISADNPNGEVIYEYSKPVNSLITYNSDIPAINFPYSNKPRYNYWKYGNLLKTQIKNQGGTVIAETTNDYEFVETVVNDVNFRSIKFDVSSMYAGPRDLTPSAYQQYINLQWDAYYFNPGRAQVTKTTVKNYDGEAATKETNYSYNTNNFQLESSNTKMSDGTVSGQTIFYPTVTTTDVPITKLKNANVLNVPIAQMSWMKDSEAASVKKLKAASATIFQEVPGFGIKPFKIYASELSEPSVTTIQDSYLPENIGSYSILKLKKTISYNEYLPIQQTENEGMTSSTIYGYNNRFPIALTKNVVVTEVAATSFEDAAEGGFNYDNLKISQAKSFTGKNCFLFPPTAQSSVSCSGMNTSKMYKMSFWVKSVTDANGVPLNNYIPSVVINNINPTTYINPTQIGNSGLGWKLYEVKLQNAASVRIVNYNPAQTASLSFTTQIDEVRICPIDAAMVTSTWDALFGKTSETDANNKTIFYEYDGSARVRLVRDLDGNILKKTCYNMAGQPENCSGISFGNDAQQRTIGRSNCPPYNLPSGVTYTVPKDKYVSFISKDDANIQAQHEIDLNGSAYANDPANGATCTPYCYFEFQAGISSVYSNITKSGTTISFTVVFSNTFTGITPNGQSITLGNIRNGCTPSVLRTVEVSENGRVWYVLIYPSGQMQTILKSGSSPSVGPAIALVGSFIL